MKRRITSLILVLAIVVSVLAVLPLSAAAEETASTEELTLAGTDVTLTDGVTSIGSYVFSGCSRLTIFCEAASKPDGWSYYWNNSNRPVAWGYTGEEYTYNFVTNGAEDIDSIQSAGLINLLTPEKDGWSIVILRSYRNTIYPGENQGFKA